MNFKCELCSYASRDKFNYDKHLNTKKHKEKVKLSLNDSHETPTPFIKNTLKNNYKCQYCDCHYSSSANLARHDKSCLLKNQLAINYEKQLIDLKNQLILKDEKINEHIKINTQKKNF